ncbi:MAG: hypothetical protein K5868_05110 [Lachnospiraceae bacterium]|nr:hypothetical protein [Lachnospiraceae bacterium]
MNKKTDLRVIKTKRAIYNALVELLKKKSLEKITVLELSEVAEINKATFYLHYTDIYALYQEALATHIKEKITEADMLKYLFRDPAKFASWLVFGFWNPAEMATDPFFNDQNLIYNRTMSYHICKAFTDQVFENELIEESRENMFKLEFFFTGIAFLRNPHPETDNGIIVDTIADTLHNLFSENSR